MNLPAIKVFLEEDFSGFAFIRQEWVNIPNFGSKGVVKVDLMVVGSRWWNVVSGFLGKDGSKVREFRGEGLFGFCLFSSGCKFSGSSDLGNFFF